MIQSQMQQFWGSLWYQLPGMSFLGSNDLQGEAAYSSWVNAIWLNGGSTINWRNGNSVSINWSVAGGVYGTNNASGAAVDVLGAIDEATTFGDPPLFGVSHWRVILTGAGFPGGFLDPPDTMYCVTRPWCQNTTRPFGMQDTILILGNSCPVGQVWECSPDWIKIPLYGYFFFNYDCEIPPSFQWSPMENCTEGP
jgi:hypothetical protein